MCNLYDLGPAPRRARFDWEEALRELLGELTYVAPGKPGLVAREADGGLEGAVMRWGFHRSWTPTINNARDDKLEGRTWKEAWTKRRCVLPVRRFYEWSGPKGAKTKHTVRADSSTGDDGWFWVGGLWEENADPEIGLSYTMVTTAASPQMAPLHDRMPFILAPDSVKEFVLSRDPPRGLVKPYAGELIIDPPPPAGEESAGLFPGD